MPDGRNLKGEYVFCQNPDCKRFGVRCLALRAGKYVQVVHRRIEVWIEAASTVVVTCPSCKVGTTVVKPLDTTANLTSVKGKASSA